MAPGNAPRDDNRIPTLLGQGNISGKPTPVGVDEATDRLLANVTGVVSIEDSAGSVVLTVARPTAMSITAGTPTGTLANVQQHDETYLVIQESATTGLTAEFTFAVPVGTEVNEIAIHGRYEGGGTHKVDVEIYDYALAQWIHISDENADFTNDDQDRLVTISTHNTNFASGTGEVKVRIKHNVTTYNTNHVFYMDYILVNYYSSVLGFVEITNDVQLAHLSGNGTDTSRTLTDANTAYQIPATPPTVKYTLIVTNISDTTVYLRFTTGVTDGFPIIAGEKFSIDLDGNDSLYAYCASAGKKLNVSYKEVV